MKSRTHVRRVQLVGYSTLAVSLPKRWASRVGLSKGSRVLVEELPDGALLLRPGEASWGSEGKLVAELGLPEGIEVEVERGVIALYEAGYDVIRVVAPRAALRVVRRLLKRLSGVEVVAESDESVTLEVVLDHASLSFERVLARMAELVQLSLSDLNEYTGSRNPELLWRVIERDDELDKFYFLLVRQSSMCLRKLRLAQELGLRGVAEVYPLLYYGKTLERMGDTLVQLAMCLGEFTEQLDARTIQLMRKAFTLAVRAFTTGDPAAAKELTLLYAGSLADHSSTGVLSSVPRALAVNFLALCVDVLDSRVELEATRRPIS